MSEAKLWNDFKEGISNEGDWSRIESHATSDGFPDCVGCVDGVPILLELKYSDTNKPPKIRASQARWHRRWSKHGRGQSWILVEWAGIYMLFEGHMAEHLVRTKEPEQWNNMAVDIWLKGYKDKWDEMLDIMVGR